MRATRVSKEHDDRGKLAPILAHRGCALPGQTGLACDQSRSRPVAQLTSRGAEGHPRVTGRGWPRGEVGCSTFLCGCHRQRAGGRRPEQRVELGLISGNIDERGTNDPAELVEVTALPHGAWPRLREGLHTVLRGPEEGCRIAAALAPAHDLSVGVDT